VHPGYGFLAENAAFARRLQEAGVTFIGPPAAAIEAMGSKTRARELMAAAGVPIVPGTTSPVETLADARAAAEQIGYPIAVKAAGGGGGKGFRVALEPDRLRDAFEGAAREGEKFFSDATVYLERYLPDPRHVEVQVLADAHGSVIHLGERDCSIQRRHQKLIEESPAPLVDDALRERIGTIATEAARAVADFAFDVLRLDEIVSLAVVANERSRAVMRRLGMTHDPADDFDHPLVEQPHLRHHVLYRLTPAAVATAPSG
jgi:acetyl-CoA/propionyl-CoA carboxylase biotin carboxyl carrier protein